MTAQSSGQVRAQPKPDSHQRREETRPHPGIRRSSPGRQAPGRLLRWPSRVLGWWSWMRERDRPGHTPAGLRHDWGLIGEYMRLCVPWRVSVNAQ